MPRATFGRTMRRIATLLFCAATLWLAITPLATADVYDDNPATASRGPHDGWIFARAADGTVLERHLVNDKWTDWVSLGGNTSSGPAAAAYHNTIHVFVRGGDGATYENVLQSNGWSGWVSLGGFSTSAPAANTRRSEDALDLVVKGGDNQLYQQAYTSAAGWPGFAPIGGNLTSGASINSQAPGYLNIWARGIDGTVQQRSWTSTAGWVDWSSVDGGIIGAPTSVSRADNVIDLFVRGAGNGTYQRSWTPAGWGAWTLLDPTPMDSSPAAAAQDANREWIVARRGQSLAYRQWDAVSGWTGWQDLGPVAVPAPPAAPSPPPPPAPDGEVNLETGVTCTPPGGRLRVNIKVRKPKGKAKPRVTKIVFYTKGKGRNIRVDTKSPFVVRIKINRPAGSTGRVYARVYYKRSAHGKVHRKTVSRRYTVCR
jgi:hypothetical protein